MRRIATGAFGAVFEARRLSHARPVALKLLEPLAAFATGSSALAAEAGLLAQLDHPGVARVYGRGEIDLGFGTTAYIEMEYVDGPPIDAYVRAHDVTVGELVKLLLGVCEAVTHAHARGIVHADLKPSNILVDSSGRPRLVDFGVSRRLGLQSARGPEVRSVGTPRYASPEQLAGEVVADELTDQYALGVIAAELLEAIRRRDGRPAAASHGSAQDVALDTVVAQACAPGRGHRPESVAAWSAALSAALTQSPGLTSPSLRRRLSRFAMARRLKWHDTLAVAVLAVTGTLAISFHYDVRGQRQTAARAVEKEQAMHERLRDVETQTEEVANDVDGLLDALEATLARGEESDGVTAGQLLDDVASRIDFASLPAHTAVRVRARLATAYTTIGEQPRARRAWDAALDLVREELEPDDQWGLNTWLDAAVYARNTDPARALDDWRECSRLLEFFAEDHPVHERYRHLQPLFTSLDSSTSDAIASFDAPLASDQDWEFEAELITGRARTLIAAGQANDAVALLEPAIARSLRELNAHDRAMLGLQATLGAALVRVGRMEDAEGLFRQVLDATLEHFGDSHPETERARTNLSAALIHLGRQEEAEKILALVAGNERLNEASATRGVAWLNQGVAAAGRRDLDEAASLLTRAVEELRAALPAGHANTLRAEQVFAGIRLLQGHDAEAVLLLEQSLAVARERGQLTEHFAILSTLAVAKARFGDIEGALDASSEGRALGAEIFPGPHPSLSHMLFTHAQLLESSDRGGEALSVYQEVIEGISSESDVTRGAVGGIGRALIDVGRVDEGFEHLTQYVDDVAPNTTLIAFAEDGLGRAALARRQYLEAAQAFERAHDILNDQMGPAHPITVRRLVEWWCALDALGRASELDAVIVDAERIVGVEGIQGLIDRNGLQELVSRWTTTAPFDSVK